MATFERIRYPDGQVSAKFVERNPHDIYDKVVRQRINSYEDLFYVRAIADVISRMEGTRKYNLFIPCMFGQRSDRRFSQLQSFDLRLITNIINDCKFGEVRILDPHSDVTLALIKNSVKETSFQYVEKVVSDIRENQLLNAGYLIDILLVAPDAGAYKKVFEFGDKLELPVMGAMKHRDGAGQISLIFSHDVEGKDCLIVDDLCDGGYTFELLAQALRDHKARSVYLYVSHGLFSKGFVKLYGLLNHIYCTNSVKDIANGPIDENVDWHEWKAGHLNEPTPEIKDFLTQYKVI